jgi:hypothetical protein
MLRRRKPTVLDERAVALIEEQRVLHGIAWDLLKRHVTLENQVDHWRNVAMDRGQIGYRELPPRPEILNALLSGYTATLDVFAARWAEPLPSLVKYQADHVEVLRSAEGEMAA